VSLGLFPGISAELPGSPGEVNHFIAETLLEKEYDTKSSQPFRGKG
jgi:hypothetical protein